MPRRDAAGMAPRTAARSPVRRRRPAASHVNRNRAFWEATSRAYDRRCKKAIGGASAMAWGLWRVPESEAHYLGPTRGRDVLELGCGAARWSIALARRGARPVGLDLSLTQLAHARAEVATAGANVPLVRGSAESIPFPSRSFDLVFCDWGAMSFADPHRTVPECARVLRPDGLLVFATASPLRLVTLDRRNDRQAQRLLSDYFGLHRVDFGDSVEFQLPYGEWFALFDRNGFTVERLVETRPPEGGSTPYLSRADSAWGRRWPMECVWRVRRR